MDTSLLYNFSGDPLQRTSLRRLAEALLGQRIQVGNARYGSIEDGITTMRLVQLKLSAGPIFGNVMRGYVPTEQMYFLPNYDVEL